MQSASLFARRSHLSTNIGQDCGAKDCGANISQPSRDHRIHVDLRLAGPSSGCEAPQALPLRILVQLRVRERRHRLGATARTAHLLRAGRCGCCCHGGGAGCPRWPRCGRRRRYRRISSGSGSRISTNLAASTAWQKSRRTAVIQSTLSEDLWT